MFSHDITEYNTTMSTSRDGDLTGRVHPLMCFDICSLKLSHISSALSDPKEEPSLSCWASDNSCNQVAWNSRLRRSVAVAHTSLTTRQTLQARRSSSVTGQLSKVSPK